ncbi:MAG: hydrogenase small subunit [Methylocystaceae bacterium]
MQAATYEQLCRDKNKANRLGSLILPLVAEHYQGQPQKPLVIWIEATGCSGNSISLWNSIGPDMQQILNNLIDVRYWHYLMAAQDQNAIASLYQSARENAGSYFLIIEGAIATKPGYDALFALNGRYISTGEVLQQLGQDAKHIMAVGTCAAFGGFSAARPNPSGSVGASAFLQRPVINVSGCPAHPDWIMGILGYLLMYGAPPVNENGQPLMFYEYTIHQRCQRRSYFDKHEFAVKIGDPECMFKLGCKGPVTHADCPVRLWNGYVNWPVKANTPCIGCTNPAFPDASEPFFEPLPEKHQVVKKNSKRRTRRVKMQRRRR